MTRRTPTPAVRRVVAAAVACAAAAAVTGCGEGDAGTTELTVFAASSLRAPFEALEEEFERAHPGVALAFSFAGSSDLVAQLEQGAPADVIATADAETMQRLAASDVLAGKAMPFATNALMIATPPDNPAGIGGVRDLAREGLQLVTCAPQVPCGAAAVKVAREAGIELAPVSEEPSVAEVLGKVRSGEADAGLVYVTDVRLAGDDVRGIAIDSTVVNTYPIAAVADSDEDALARAFIALVTGAAGQRVLADAGFGQP